MVLMKWFRNLFSGTENEETLNEYKDKNMRKEEAIAELKEFLREINGIGCLVDLDNVSPALRDFLQNKISNSDLETIQIIFSVPGKIELKILSKDSKSVKFEYHKIDEFKNTFWKDLAIILRRQKTAFWDFAVHYRASRTVPSTPHLSDFYSKLEIVLKSIPHSILTEHVRLYVEDQTQVLQVLQYIVPATVNSIVICQPHHGRTIQMNFDEISQLSVWNHVSRAVILFYPTGVPFWKFLHFKECALEWNMIAEQEIALLKFAFTGSKTMKHFEIKFKSSEDNFILPLGEPYSEVNGVKNWMFPTCCSNRRVQVSWNSRHSHIEFRQIMTSEEENEHREEELIAELEEFLEEVYELDVMSLSPQLRDFFIQHGPDFKLDDIRITLEHPLTIELELGGKTNQVTVQYRQFDQGNNDFFQDVALLLKRQSTIFDEFCVYFCIKKPSDAIFAAKFYSKLETVLKNIQPIRVNWVTLIVENETQALQVLPYLDPSAVNFILMSHPVKVSRMNIEKIVELPLWNRVTSMYIWFYITGPSIGNFLHFEKCSFELETITKKEVALLRFAFLDSDHMKSFRINYEESEDQFTAPLGTPSSETDSETHWIIKKCCHNRSLEVTLNKYCISFDWIPTTEVVGDVG